MNRYLVRAFVAILTFSIGVVLGSIFRTATPTYQYELRHKRCKEVVSDRQRVYEYAPQGASPSVVIDSASTDPLKLQYAQTRLNPTGPKSQVVDFSVEPTTRHQVSKFTISYRSRWSSNNHGGGGAVAVTNPSGTMQMGLLRFDNVSIACDVDETLSVWVSSVEFNDGSRWENPRHTFN